MTDTSPADRVESVVDDLFRLQQRLTIRTADYFGRLANLAGQGSVEPRAYIEAYFGWISGGLQEIGDTVSPRARTQRALDELPVTRWSYEMRPERGDLPFKVPVEIFNTCGDHEVVRLSTDGLIRAFDPQRPLQPVVALGAIQNVDVAPHEVRCDTRTTAELKVFGVKSLVAPDERYEGLIWGSLRSDPTIRFVVAAIEILIV